MERIDTVAAIARFGTDDVPGVVAAIRRDGVAVLDGLWPQQRIAGLHGALAAHYPEYVATGGELPDDHRAVGTNRFLSPIAYAAPFDCADILLHPVLSALCSAMLGDQFVFEAFGVICARPGAEDQGVHSDGGALFPEQKLDAILPPAALAISCPLVAVAADNGGTAFLPGSQRNPTITDGREFVTAALPLGSCQVWDLRILHHGRRYLSSETRPVIYATVCRPFWIDHRNFEPGRNAKLLASRNALAMLDADQRRRFVRAEIS